MTTHDADDWFSTMGMSRQQMSLLSQIEKSIMSMHHIDELFQWLSNALVQHFNIQLLLFWTNHVDQAGQLVVQLRTAARQDASLPEQIVMNEQVQRIAQRLINERQSYEPQPLETIFSHYQTILLKRHGMNYWSVCFTSKNALLPPRLDAFARRESPAFLAMTTLVFFRQLPQPGITSIIGLLLERALDLALTRGLLLPSQDSQYRYSPSFADMQTPLPQFPSASPSSPMQTPAPFSAFSAAPLPPASLPPAFSATPFPPASLPPAFAHEPESHPIQELQSQPLFTQLILSRKQDADIMLAVNPFSHTVGISDRKARRLHTAIDGRVDVGQLMALTGLNTQEISAALRLLWDQQRVEAHEPGGKPVNLLFFLKDR
jgi:hypothetical protein